MTKTDLVTDRRTLNPHGIKRLSLKMDQNYNHEFFEFIVKFVIVEYLKFRKSVRTNRVDSIRVEIKECV